jgi:hypothetical protein
MASAANRGAYAFVRTIGVGMVAMGLSMGAVGVRADAQESRTFEIWDFGVQPRPSLKSVLLGMEVVKNELKMTDAQKKEMGAIEQRESAKLREARRDIPDRAKFLAARDAIFKEATDAIEANLKPEQLARLDQIQLQAQGPIAFHRPGNQQSEFIGPPLAERLKLSDDQVQKIREIARASQHEIATAATFPITLEAKDKTPTAEEIQKLLDSPEFKAAKQKARQAARDKWAAVIGRIEEVLTTEQRELYRKQLGTPFDLLKLRVGPQNERQDDFMTVRQAYGGGGGGGGQQADPEFNTKMTRPAYANSPWRPRVLFDEAHHNFHTASGRYKPFADLITSDGYQVIPSKEKFSRETLQRGDVLVIANALGADGLGAAGAENPAFTDAECDAVRDWIAAGGTLLFITDHAPMGSAAQPLAIRLGVSMSTGSTSDPVNSEGGETSLVFSRQNQLLGNHPITWGRDPSERLNRIQTFTGTSVRGPAWSVPFLKLADTAVDDAFDDDKTVSAAGRAQGVAFRFGYGRVVFMGEAAELSAQVAGGEKFGMNVPGLDNRQMALNIVHWLTGLLEPGAAMPTLAGAADSAGNAAVYWAQCSCNHCRQGYYAPGGCMVIGRCQGRGLLGSIGRCIGNLAHRPLFVRQCR